MENIVIKDPLTEYPYIPGSSLKGKMRSLLEWSKSCYNTTETCVERELRRRLEELNKEKKELTDIKVPPCNCGKCDVCIVFGSSADVKLPEGEISEGPTRLTVRDVFPTQDTKDRWKKELGENIYTEVKTENVIYRITSEANPRPLERVPAGSVFEVEMVYDVYKETDKEKMKLIFEGLKLLEDSALGGSGTRGSGKVKFNNFKIEFRDTDYYLKPNQEPKSVSSDNFKTPKDVLDNFDQNFEIK